MQYRHHPVASQTGPDFAASLPTNGYGWWYVDALSDCGQHGLTMIAMLGCVFSPWYAWALDQQRVLCTYWPVASAALAGTQIGEGV